MRPLLATGLLAPALSSAAPAQASVQCEIGPFNTYPVCVPNVCVGLPQVDPQDPVGTVLSVFPTCTT